MAITRSAWSPDLDKPRNEELSRVSQKYNYWPSFYAAQSFDATMIDHAVAAVKGDLTDKKGMIAALKRPIFRRCAQIQIQHQPLSD